ncbi:MAG: trigger factor [Candidatus Sericytochromatia bacterium]|nr:trigger factor [Candidatus Sericytochromatia bacterium]
MKVTLEKQESNKIALNVEVEQDVVSKEYEKAFRQASAQLNIPGFRKGKAPKKIAERYLHIEAIFEEAINQVISKAYSEAVNNEQLEPITEPQIELVHAGLDKDLVFTAKIEVRPEVTLGEYKGMTVEATGPDAVGDTQITEKLEELRKKQAQLVPVEGRPAAMGDVALIDFAGFVDEAPLPNGAHDNYLVELKDGVMIPGFVEHFVGMSTGESKTASLTFPAEYFEANLQGKEARFELTLKELKAHQLPELDDEMAKGAGAETLDALKERLKGELEAQREEATDLSRQQAVMDQVLENAQVDVPESMAERELQAMWMQQAKQMQAQGADQAALQASWETAKADDNAKAEAHRRIKTSLVLGTVARAEGITLDQDEVNAEIDAFAAAFNVPADRVRQQLYSENKVLALMDELLSLKIMAWLLEQNTVNITDAATAA